MSLLQVLFLIETQKIANANLYPEDFILSVFLDESANLPSK